LNFGGQTFVSQLPALPAVFCQPVSPANDESAALDVKALRQELGNQATEDFIVVDAQSYHCRPTPVNALQIFALYSVAAPAIFYWANASKRL
jgi:hypothetical protein